MIDLHMHSTFSDGSLTPEQLVQRGQSLGLTAMALTDHDCTGGIDRFLEASGQYGVEGISGVEVSADVRSGTMHVLGYFMDHRNEDLEGVLVQIRSGRKTRNEEILTKLNRLGFALTWDEVAAFVGEDVVGRPHFASALQSKGYVRTKEEAFDKYLSKGKSAYADRFRLLPADCIAVIRKAGGVAVLAHPSTLELDRKGLRTCVDELKEAGLQGIEAYYSEHSPELTREYATLARDSGIVATGGSDFHGDINPKIELGRGFGSLRVPGDVVEKLRHARLSDGQPAR